MNTFVVRQPPAGDPVLSVPFPADMEGHGLAHYVITHKPPLRRGGPERFLLYLVLDADGLCLNDNLSLACEETLRGALDRARVGFDDAEVAGVGS